MELKESKHEQETNEPERTSGIMRVVGVNPENEEVILEYFKSVIEKGEKHSFKPEWEREKTPEEQKMISEILKRLPNFIKKLGGNPVPIKPENIHFLDVEKIKKEGYLKGNFERYDWSNQEVSFCPEGGRKTVEVLVHELMHFESFQSVTHSKEDSKKYQRRIGLLIYGKKDGFQDLNEALTQELTIRFLREYYGNPALGNIVGDQKYGSLKYMGGVELRLSEVYQFRGLLLDIYKKNLSEYDSQEDIFKIFIQGYLNGRLLPIARLIEKTYGKGSFRKLTQK